MFYDRGELVAQPERDSDRNQHNQSLFPSKPSEQEICADRIRRDPHRLVRHQHPELVRCRRAETVQKQGDVLINPVQESYE